MLPDTFVERAIQTALDMDTQLQRVMLTPFEASFIRQKYAERNAHDCQKQDCIGERYHNYEFHEGSGLGNRRR